MYPRPCGWLARAFLLAGPYRNFARPCLGFVSGITLCPPFVAAHLRIDPIYSGGDLSHVLPRDAYRIIVNRPVLRRSPLQRVDPFVQLTWTPAGRLPAHVSDAVNIDGDGIPDVRVSFDSAPGPGNRAGVSGVLWPLHFRSIRIIIRTMPAFTGSITTTGKSEAIRLDKALFRLHPEFRQKAKVRAQVISPGHALISVIGNETTPLDDEDPVVTAFLAFLEKDLIMRPGRRSRLSKTSIGRAVRLTKRVTAKDDEVLPEDVSF